jgi:hypothetical protein
MAQKKLNMEQITNETRYLSGWLKFLGIAKIIQGAFLVMTIFGALHGAITIWEGLLLNRAANGSREVTAGNLEFMAGEMLNPLKIYFVIQGVLIILIFGGFIMGLLALTSLIGTGFFAHIANVFNNF